MEIIGFPSKQFGGQEFDTADEIAKFVTKFNVQFNLGAMTDVNTDSALWSQVSPGIPGTGC